MKIQTTRVYTEVDKAIKSGYTAISAQGSSRSSKTYNILIWLILYCLNHPKTRLSIVRATLPAIRGSVFQDFKDILTNRMKIWNEKNFKDQKFIYYFSNGSWVEFFSTDSEQKIRGRKRDVLYVNEANELSHIEFQQLKMRTSRFTIVDYNPSFSDDHWLCNFNKDKRTYHFISTYKDNPFLEQTIIDEIESLRETNQSLWQIYGLGLQAVVEGLIFKHINVIEKIPPQVRHRWVGVDLGFTNDPTAIVEVGVLDKNLYIDEKCYKTEMLSSDIIRELKEKCPRKKVISESADPRLIKEIYRGGVNIFPVKKFKGSIMAGITKMLEYNIYITKNSYNVQKEFKNYTYKQDKEEKWLNEPIDAYNHAIDATRYVVMTELLGGEKRAINKQRIARAVY